MRRTWVLPAVLVLSAGLAAPALGKADGAAVYQRCFACHQSTGGGVAGVFPPLAGHAPDLVKADRTYPIKVVLYGLKGGIEVEGKQYKGEMPGHEGQLKDEEIAAVLNYVLSSWGNDKLLPKGFAEITPAEVKAQRAKKLTQEQVHEFRQKIGLK